MRPPAALATVLITLLLAILPARAQDAQANNRDLPVNIDADKVTVDDRNKIHTFEGNVKLTQGTLTIKSEKLVVTQGADGFHTGVATGGSGGLASFNQKRARDGADVYGEAERIEYSSRSEKARLFNRAHVVSGGDKVSGPFIEYDAVTENYLVTNAASHSGSAPPAQQVHVTIQPKSSSKGGAGANTPH